MSADSIFSKIVHHEVSADILYQDDFVTAFHDAFPKAPIHILIIPNLLIPTINDVKHYHEPMLGRLFTVAAKIAKRYNVDCSGYRLIINCNKNAGQEIFYLHMHFLSGKFLGPLLNLS